MDEQLTAPGVSSAVVSWLQERAMPLSSTVAGQGFGDLQPLKSILAGVRLVGLGEATHGTREFFQLKHRLIEFLAKEMGYTVFAIEASYPACLKINDYVLYGQGDRAKALAGQGFWTWNTEEVSEMIEWMRQYNLTQPECRKLRFYGYDVQNVRLALDLIQAYVNKVAPEYAGATAAALSTLVALYSAQHSTEGDTDPTRKVEAVQRLYQLIGYLSMHRTRFVRMSSAAEYEEAVEHARVCLQYEQSYGKPVDSKQLPVLRDLYMAENIEYIAKTLAPEAKIIVWAHNAHISTGQYMDEVPSMGEHLRQLFGDQYYALGLAFNEGSFQARAVVDQKPGALTEFTVPPAREGTLDWYLALARLDKYMIDFRHTGKPDEIEQWLGTPLPMRMIGSGFASALPPEACERANPANCFDGLIHLSRTTRARPTPTGVV